MPKRRNTRIFKSEKVFVDGEIKPACIFVKDGKVSQICGENEKSEIPNLSNYEVVDVGSDLIMPGVVDAHVHVNEPGRTAWEGYITATRAAAAGGVSTIVDMPLNSIPSTVTLEAFKTKLESAKDKCTVDVGFWGGIVPGNQNELLPMLKAGVCGFKCFLIHSGVDDFPAVERSDLDKAFVELQGTDTVVLFHAEVDCNCTGGQKDGAPESYQTFLETRPEQMEVDAIQLVCDLCLKYKVRCHIVHLSAASALPLIIKAKADGAPLTVETTHHYLTLDAETIPEGATQYKCCPPIRDKHNQELLWKGIVDGHIDLVVSDHSPCTPDLKHLETGDFLTAWGGIASVQFGLSLFWTNAQKYGLGIEDVVRLLCQNTSQLAGLQHRKGTIATGYDADFVVWKPDQTYTIKTENIQHKNKVTPYLEKTLQGAVTLTVLGGDVIYNSGVFEKEGSGSFLLLNSNETNSNERASFATSSNL